MSAVIGMISISYLNVSVIFGAFTLFGISTSFGISLVFPILSSIAPVSMVGTAPGFNFAARRLLNPNHIY